MRDLFLLPLLILVFMLPLFVAYFLFYDFAPYGFVVSFVFLSVFAWVAFDPKKYGPQEVECGEER